MCEFAVVHRVNGRIICVYGPFHTLADADAHADALHDECDDGTHRSPHNFDCVPLHKPHKE